MPPETPTTTVRPRSMAARLLSQRLFVEERHFVTDGVIERDHRRLPGTAGERGLAALARPFVHAPRLARRDDAQLVLVRSRRGNQRSQFHPTPPRLVKGPRDCATR